MICYRCGSKLGAGRRCLRCGADVTLYRKIVRTSNSYYNAGLDKAELRDLTGAAECLVTCLQYNKNHIDARNLLGLIYFETGEVCEALGQWVISTHIQPENNRANEYLAYLKSEQNMLDDMNQAVKKYNQALEQARIEGADLAMITLKRVLKQQPHMLKAYELLALLYINEGDYSRANRLLKKALEIDKGNTLCQTYIRQIRGKLGRGGRAKAEEKKKKTQPPELLISRLVEGDEDESLVPTVKEHSGPWKTIGTLLLGMAIAMCMYQFVILRTVNHNANVKENAQIASYDSKLADKQRELDYLQQQLDTMQAEMESREAEVDAVIGENGLITQYESLLAIMREYVSSDPSSDSMVSSFKGMTRDISDNEDYQALYDKIYNEVISTRISRRYQTGLNQMDVEDYEEALNSFSQCLELNPDYDKAIYKSGLCYDHLGQNEKAKEMFVKIVTEYPNSDFYEAAVDIVGEDPLQETTAADESSAAGETGAEDGEDSQTPEGEEAVPE